MHSQLPDVLNILLADDDSDDRFFFEKALNELPVKHKLKTVADGEELMAYLLSSKTILPDALFLDLNMPCKNGAECLKEIKQNEKLRTIPVIIHSTSLNLYAANELYNNGAHYYLHKAYFTELALGILAVIDLLSKNRQQPARGKFIVEMQEYKKKVNLV